MKIAIILAGLLIAVAAAFLSFSPASLRPADLAVVKKSDIFGFSPGMTFEEVNKLVTQRRYRCRPHNNAYTLECSINSAKVIVFNDDASDKHPVWRVNAELENPGPEEAAVKAISERYHAQSTKDAKGRWVWVVGRDYKLTYDGTTLILVDEVEERRLQTTGR